MFILGGGGNQSTGSQSKQQGIHQKLSVREVKRLHGKSLVTPRSLYRTATKEGLGINRDELEKNTSVRPTVQKLSRVNYS